ncbi:MAG TPA: hypothetical protein VFN35_05785 [Ktedonobacteraceae bacterium]|nr:hypothetical protein [Ktedonobacteraceae bacterium]
MKDYGEGAMQIAIDIIARNYSGGGAGGRQVPWPEREVPSQHPPLFKGRRRRRQRGT